MDPVLAAVAVPPALALGSFLNVVAARLPVSRSVVGGRSACLSCESPIPWHDNIPIVSYCVLRGRCRNCGAAIGVRYLLVELATALLVAACLARFGLTGEGLVAAFFVAVLVLLSAIDVERRILPDRIVLPAAVAVLAANCALAPDRALEWGLAALAASGFLFGALVAYPRGMGMGDVKLAVLLGAALGTSVAVAMAIGLFAALAVGVVILVRQGAAGRKTAIPFGPFLAFGAVVALFAGEPLLDAYLGLF